jgi:hypothetical protein
LRLNDNAITDSSLEALPELLNPVARITLLDLGNNPIHNFEFVFS